MSMKSMMISLFLIGGLYCSGAAAAQSVSSESGKDALASQKPVSEVPAGCVKHGTTNVTYNCKIGSIVTGCVKFTGVDVGDGKVVYTCKSNIKNDHPRWVKQKTAAGHAGTPYTISHNTFMCSQSKNS